MNVDLKLRIVLAAACVGIAVVIWPSNSRLASSELISDSTFRGFVTIGSICLQTAFAFRMIYRHRWFKRIAAATVASFAVIGLLSATLSPSDDPWLNVQLVAAFVSLLMLLKFLAMQRRLSEPQR
jgi:hypothetical protein